MESPAPPKRLVYRRHGRWLLADPGLCLKPHVTWVATGERCARGESRRPDMRLSGGQSGLQWRCASPSALPGYRLRFRPSGQLRSSRNLVKLPCGRCGHESALVGESERRFEGLFRASDQRERGNHASRFLTRQTICSAFYKSLHICLKATGWSLKAPQVLGFRHAHAIRGFAPSRAVPCRPDPGSNSVERRRSDRPSTGRCCWPA